MELIRRDKDMKNCSEYLKLTFVTHDRYSNSQEYLDFICDCITSGITSIQFREKNTLTEEVFAFGQQLKNLLRPLKIPLIVNDHVDLCLRLDAEGVHLGQKDYEVQEVRKQLGPTKIIGLTIETEEQLQKANELPKDCINYIGIGSIFPSITKPEAGIIGIEILKRLVILSKYPVVAIGGITEKNVASVIQTGVHGIAALDAFHEMKYPKEKIPFWRSAIEKNMRNY
jgi:thiamine-phosphate pyrophosphorylase